MSREQNRGSMHGPGGMRLTAERPKQFKRTLYRLLRYLRPRTVPIILVFIMAILGTGFAIFGPKIMRMTNTVLFEGAYESFSSEGEKMIDFSAIAKLLILLAILYFISSLFQFLQQFVMATVAQRTVYDLREDVFSKLHRLPIRYFDSRSY